eukprot:TRINITY_DN1299_c0_g1_i2.p1 TRINITY_DN1299_c0_g1~~TRINITY_DN1299_c0_g1_i2.p1  ORF type:complete len:378 (-),score=40.34 TRINITY_DN1299_c0_g1_i2:133-1104(-)
MDASQQTVAIKRVLQDIRYKNRELQIMKMIKHPNTVALLNSFFEKSRGEVYLNLVLAYVPQNLFEVCSAFAQRNEKMPDLHISLYMYQLCRSLAYIHSLGICHRDIKPQNLLVNPETQELKLCDFGSAKILVRGEPNVAYICSRYYRAPELIFSASDYSPAIDVWSAGCVMAELILGEPIFAGKDSLDQLIQIIKVLGTPSREDIRAMNTPESDFDACPVFQPCPWTNVFPRRTSPESIDLVSQMLIYTPTARLGPLKVCAHPYFDILRENHANRHSSPRYAGSTLPLFALSSEELASAHLDGFLEQLLPMCELEHLTNHRSS